MSPDANLPKDSKPRLIGNKYYLSCLLILLWYLSWFHILAFMNGPMINMAIQFYLFSYLNADIISYPVTDFPDTVKIKVWEFWKLPNCFPQLHWFIFSVAVHIFLLFIASLAVFIAAIPTRLTWSFNVVLNKMLFWCIILYSEYMSVLL